MNEHASSSLAMYVEVNSQRHPLKLGQIYMFCREASTEEKVFPEYIINVNDKDVDQKHCCVATHSVEEGAFVFDLLSKFGTFLNGERLKPLERTLIKHGDVMRLGTTRNVKFYNEQMETSHNSSGYGEANKNTSDIICSSPESNSNRESRMKLCSSNSNKSLDDSDKFLVPAVPHRISLVGTESDIMSTSRVSLGLNFSNNQSRRSDSFTIPETQHCKPCTSTTSNLSIADSDAEEDRTKSDFNLDSFGVNEDGEEDFCIPETQDIVPSSQVPRSLRVGNVANGLKTLEERSVDLNDSDDEDLLGGSQFRICTQDYNEGFGEEDNESMLHSQVIPLIKHTTVLLNGSNETRTPDKKTTEDGGTNEANAAQEEDKELANINWSSTAKADAEQMKNITSTCSTPDIFDFEAFDNAKAPNGNENNDNLFEDNASEPLEEDYMATQVFPSRNSNNKTNEQDKATKEKDILSGKDDEQYLTLSDKENLQPDRLEPITDLPPTQLFAIREVSGERPLPSTSLRKIGLNQPETKPSPITVPTLPAPSIVLESNTPLLPQAPFDEEDDILTQAYPQPSKTPTKNVLSAPKTNCFNSTLLDDKAVDRNPASFFADMEKTPKKAEIPKSTLDVFKIPEIGFASVKKASSAASTSSNVTTCSESDMDLLMCTPQLIKDHLEFSKPDDLRKHILAAKTKILFGDDTDDGEETDDDRNSRDKCLVQLINIPKNSKDFDQLLPHLKNDDNRLKRKSTLSDEQNAAKEAYKEYKFNLSFGHEQEKSLTSSNKPATQSRDERHAARDKEREMEEKRGSRSTNISEDKQQNHVKRSSRRTRHDEEASTAGNVATVALKVKDKGAEEKQPSRKHGNPNQENEKQEAAFKSSKNKEKVATTVGKAIDALKVRGKGAEEQQPSKKQGNPNEENEKQEAAFKKNSSSKNKEKDATTVGKATGALRVHEREESGIKGQENEEEETVLTKKEKSSSKKKEQQATAAVKDKDALMVSDKGVEKQRPNRTKRSEDDENTRQGKEGQETALMKRSSGRNKEAKDTKEKPEKSKKVVKGNDDKYKKEDEESSENTASSATNKNDDVRKEEQEEKRPKRGRKHINSTDKAQESSNDQQKSIEAANQLPKVRLTRLKSTASSSSAIRTESDELDLIPTQPLRRNTRTYSRSTQKDPNESLSSATSTSTTVSRASSANRSLTRSNSRLNVSTNAVANESAAKAVSTTTPSSSKTVERKRKAEVPVPTQPNNEGKRLRRTISEDSKILPVPIKTTPSRCLISMTMVDPVKFKELASKADGLWAVAKDPAHSNVLVMDMAYRTFKFLLAMARGIPIVTSQWLKQVNDTKSLQKSPLNEYLFYDPVFEKRHKFSLAKSLKMAKASKWIFKGYEFVMTPNIQPQPAEIRAIIESAGGTVLAKLPSPTRNNPQIYLISSLDDRRDWHKFRRISQNIIIVSTEAIMTSIMQQNCSSLSKYVLS